jgi:hypothetical protein
MESRLQNYRFVSGHDFSRAVNAPIWIPALAAAELHVIENNNAGAKQSAEKLRMEGKRAEIEGQNHQLTFTDRSCGILTRSVFCPF